jgi:hypothetical protein
MFNSRKMSACRAIARGIAQAKPIFLVAAIMLSGVRANADSVSTYSAPISGFVANSALAAGSAGTSYLAAQGAPTEFLSFSTDKSGNPVADGNTAGNIYSNFVTFSSGGSSSVAQGNGDSSSSEIGPTPHFGGTFNIQFVAPVFAVAFGAVDPFTYTAYDSLGNIITSGTTGADTFDFLGLVDNSGSNIASLQLNGTFYAIQDLQYGTTGSSAVPEPSSLVLLAIGLCSLLWLVGARRRGPSLALIA